MRWVGAYVGAMTCLAANAQGMVLTLSAVEMITSFAVPLSCIFAYNTPINGCEVGDFTSGQCSSNCQRALQRVETNIRASCDTVDAQPNSLIWEAQRGNLVNALCKSDPPKQSTTRAQPQPTPSSTSATSITVTISPSSSTSSETPLYTLTTSTTTLTSTVTMTPTTTQTTQTTVSSTPTDSSSRTETESQTDTEASSTASTSSRETTSVTEISTPISSSTSTTKASKPTRNPEAGAGDPFANVPNSSNRLGLCVWSFLFVLFVICLM